MTSIINNSLANLNQENEGLSYEFNRLYSTLIQYLYDNNCLGINLYNKLNIHLHNSNLNNSIVFNLLKIRYNALVYILIQKYICEMNYDYNVLYDNVFYLWEEINEIAVSHTPEEILQLNESEITNDEFIDMFKYLNHFDDYYGRAEQNNDTEEHIFIINFKNVFNDLNVYLYNNGCLSTKLFNYMTNSIEQANLRDSEIKIYMRERYNALCYLYIKKLIEEYVDFYDYYVLYINSFYFQSTFCLYILMCG